MNDYAAKLRAETERDYPRILAAYGQAYARGWQTARDHIAEELEKL